jgi:uncharacterized protein involved in exopolysaccharide biosynthesis
METLGLSVADRKYIASSDRPNAFGKVLLKRWRLALAVFSILFGLTLLFAALLPRQYEATMRLLVKNERVDALISPDKGTQGIFYLDDIAESRVNTEVALLLSNDLLRQVVQQCRLGNTVKASHATPAMREELALNQLKGDLAVTPLRKSAIILLRYESPDRARSVNVLNVLSQLYLDSHLRLRGAPGSYAFFRELSRRSTAEREEADLALARFKLEHNIVTLPEEKTIALQREADLDKHYADAAAAAARSMQQSTKLSSLVSQTPASVVNERRSIPNQYETQQLSTLLVGLQNKRVETAARYQPDDRVVQDLDQQIAQTKGALAGATIRKAEEVSTIANPVLGSAQSDFVRAQYESAGYQAEMLSVGRRLAANKRRLTELDSQTAAYNDLNQDVLRLTALDHEYREKADQARVSQLLDEQRISNVAVAEEAYSPAKASSPKIGAIVAVGFVWSLFGAIGSVIAIDRTRPRIRSTFDVERTLGAPVLAYLGSDSLSPRHGGTLAEVYLSMDRPTDKKVWRIA